MAELDLSLQYRWGTGPADRQHLGSAETEVMVEFLTLTGHDGSARCASYPEFEARYVRDKEVRELSLPVRNWLTGANPKSKPVLWRLLIGQAFLLRLLIDMIETGTDQAGPIPPAGLQTLLTWRSKTPLPQELEPQSAQRAATAYVLARLGRGLPDVSG